MDDSRRLHLHLCSFSQSTSPSAGRVCVGRGRSPGDCDTGDDGDVDSLTYTLARGPGGGQLQRDGVMVDRFSQLDLLQGRVFYVHTGETGVWARLHCPPVLIHLLLSQEDRSDPEPVCDSVTVIISDGGTAARDVCCHGDAPPPAAP